MSVIQEGLLPPPSYSRQALTDNIPLTIPDSDLPIYPGRRERPAISTRATIQTQLREFPYDVRRRDKPLATLTLTADGTISRQLATYFEGDPVTGTFKLSLEKPETIQSIVLTLQGQLVFGANKGEQLTFMEILSTLWTASTGEPQPLTEIDSTSPISSTTPDSPKTTTKLQGEYTWNFRLKIPKEVVIGYGTQQELRVFTLPQTFNERHARASVVYGVILRLDRGKLRPDHKIHAPFGYIPLSRPPEPFSFLRQLAYQDNSPVVGPMIDPEGWYALPGPNIRGHPSGHEPIDVCCTLYLAKPLTYTRGSVIPMVLKLEGAHPAMLDLLSSPNAIMARLRRTIKYHVNDDTLSHIAWKDSIDHSQLASWWPPTDGTRAPSEGVRNLHGELNLKLDLKPTSAMGSFRIEYHVVLFPIDAFGFESKDSGPLLECPVEIVTMHLPGPRPLAYGPPNYELD